MKDDRDYKVELSNAAAADGSPPRTSANTPAGRPFISVHFACCNVYLRIYRSADGTAYRGRCPRCGKAVHFAVGEGGTDSRVFRVE
jgi:hypothetical protein